MSICIKEDLSDPKFMAKFYATVAKRNLPIVRVNPGDPWICECAEHKRKRLALKETRSLFDA